MAEITLSSAVRNNLLSLQNTSSLLAKTQERLSTGLKVNSALDDPTAFFTASSLNSRAGDLNRLLDSVGNAVQTVIAADEGLSAITKLVETAQAQARQALQKPGPAQTGGTTLGTVSFADDTASTVTGSAIAADVAAVVTAPTFANDAAVLAATGTVQITIGTGATTTLNFGTVGNGIATLAALETALDGIANVDAANTTVGAGTLNLQAANIGDDIVIVGTGGGFTAATTESAAGGGTAAAFNNAVTNGDTLTFTINGQSDTLTFGATDPAISNRTELAAALTALNSSSNTGAAFSLNGGGQIVVTSASVADGSLTITGTGDALTLAGFSNNQTETTTNAALAASSDVFTVQNGSATAQNVDLSTVDSTSGLNTLLASLTGVNASVNSAGRVEITATDGTESLTIGGTVGTVGLTASTFNSTAVNNADRAALEVEYNNLRTQIDQLAGDASFNGNNLLDGDSLTVFFNESSTSTLAITGVTFDSAGLNISAAATDSFQTDANINAALAELDTAIGTLRQQASTFGSNLSVVEVREEFTKNLINTLETGAGNLTLADANLEGANTLALQTRQQLSSVALSLATQADQNVLRLF